MLQYDSMRGSTKLGVGCEKPIESKPIMLTLLVMLLKVRKCLA